MIKLRKAREKVAEIIGAENTPAYTTLGDWIYKGVISGKVEGKYKKAKYPDLIVAEIITAIRLKKEQGYKLIDIAEFREAAGLNDNIKNINEFKRCLYNYTHQLQKKYNEINNIKSNDEITEKLIIMRKLLDRSNKFDFKVSILKAYNREFGEIVNIYSIV